MKYAVTFIYCILIGLTGCSQIQSRVDLDIQKVATPDFTAALADATAANHSEGITCWGWFSSTIAALPTNAGTATSGPQLAGAASGLEVLSELQNNPPQLLTFPKMPPAVHDACAGILMDDQLILAKFGIGAGLLAQGPATITALKQAALAKP